MNPNWPTVSLSELIQLERRTVKVNPDDEYAEIGVYSFGRGIFHKLPRTGLQVGDKDLYLIKSGDFILQITFAWEGAVALAGSDEDGMYGSVRFPTFRVDESRCYPKYLVNYFRTMQGREQLIKISPGSAGRNRVLSLKRIPEVFVPIPPLSEQQRIVARIEAIARRVEEARGLRQKAVEEADLLLGRAIVDIFSTRHEEWVTTTLGDLIIDLRYGTSEKSSDDPSGIPIYGMSNIQDGKLSSRNLKYVDLSKTEVERLKLESGDILVNRTNSAELVGKCAVFNGSGDYVYASYIIRVRLDSQRAEPRLIAAFINSPIGRQYMFEQRKQMTGQANINSQKLRAFPLHLPPLIEQHRIIAYLDGLQAKVDELKRLQAESQNELDALMPSVLAKAFAGELVELTEPVNIPVSLPQHIWDLRISVAAYIVNALHDSRKFASVQFQKILYMVEAWAGVELQGHYARAVYGPYDKKTFLEIESRANQLEAFTVRLRPDSTAHDYIPGPTIVQQGNFIEALPVQQKEKIDYLLSLFRHLSTPQSEMVATLFAAWNDFLLDDVNPTDLQIIKEVRENWHKSKGRFKPERLQEMLAWMREHKLTPAGIQPHTHK